MSRSFLRSRMGTPSKDVDDIDFLLALAGYDPERIPEKLRMAAASMADMWRGGIFDIDVIADACGLTYDEACDAQDAMRFAARPGTHTG
jgi:hypothetical protein